MKYWLLKTEPSSYSIDDLQRDGSTGWDGVRNYQARNFMRDQMKIGDLALIYHSNAKPAGVVGLARVCRESHPDETAQDPQDIHFDPKASPENPRWFMVDIEFVEKFPRMIPLTFIKEHPVLQEMVVAQRGSRLSITPVEPTHFEMILQAAREK